ncbi:cytochrome c-type biogenesis protein [Desulfitobacterium sp.]|uniref:cytochrome c-type biogenesis protein n=1 Tax=Desulfitobacterium sp. TaxID=49981 RepID=UPI002C83FB00|nr:cytochrome c-type biogenesis protein CcmH [Desulfitobacterium sp.]HVJ47689.1 cytochrome c-type biogenesis protein CcmH [Desulfitobacterium sp.]
MRKLFPLLTLVLLLLAPQSLSAQESWGTQPIPTDVESGVICVLDGCMMNLNACETPAAEKLRLNIREKMFKEGLNKEQTYAYLAQTYGEKVLAAPPKRGFNWTVWLTPFVVTIGGGALIYLGLEKWVLSAKPSEEETNPIPIEPEYEKKLEEEIKKYL